MLSELTEIQHGSDEIVTGTDLSISVETRDTTANDLVEKTYTFSYAREWETWMFSEYEERRTEDTASIDDRNWRQVQHILWHAVDDRQEITVPPEVADKLAEATGADSVTIQVPGGTVQETGAKTVQEVTQ